MNPFDGLNVTVSDQCYEMVPIFPDKPRTKRRLRRTRGKFGRVDRLNPLAYRTPFGLVMHPILYTELKRRTVAQAVPEQNGTKT